MTSHPRKRSTQVGSPGRLASPRLRHFGPFVTWLVGEGDAGDTWVVTSRRHRKNLQPLRLKEAGKLPHEAFPAKVWFEFWAPSQLSWWMALSFVLGSALFAIGAAVSLWPALWPSWAGAPFVNNLTYFIGSIFFTLAGGMQFLESINADLNDIEDSKGDVEATSHAWRWFAWRPRDLGYLASGVQFVGTILFNFSTGDALVAGLTVASQESAVWGPDMLGSVCFLAASAFGYLEVSHRLGYWNVADLALWMAVLNAVGSIAFQVSAVASYVEGGNLVWWAQGSNAGTFIGALFFLVASYLLIPELFEEEISSGNTVESS